MQLPTWHDLLPQQRDVLDHPLDSDLFVVGPPGSGKTILALRRARMIAEGGERTTIVAFHRMLRRLVQAIHSLEGTPDPLVSARTMHSWVHAHHAERTGSPLPLGYEVDWATISAAATTSANVTVGGHLVIDEGQDLATGFFRYARMHAGGVLSVFADEDQALEDSPSTLALIKEAAQLPDPFILKDNHRNAPEVAALAEHFHQGGLPAATVRRPRVGQLPRLRKAGGIEESAQLIATWVRNAGGNVGVVVARNATGTAICKELRGLLNGRVDFYDSDRKNDGEIELHAPGVTVLNERSVKGQEFDTVFLLELEQFLPCTTAKMFRVMYMLCARARDHLHLVYGPGPLSSACLAQLPDERVLERGA
jgi:superfamily I DNA/RNA helicase